jgi:hypothetical protein
VPEEEEKAQEKDRNGAAVRGQAENRGVGSEKG